MEGLRGVIMRGIDTYEGMRMLYVETAITYALDHFCNLSKLHQKT